MPAAISRQPPALSIVNRRASAPFSQVLLTYVRRPAFRVIVGAAVGWCLLAGWLWLRPRHPPLVDIRNWVVEFFLDSLFTTLPLVLLVASAAAVMRHVREQIDHWQAFLVPKFRAPHLAVAAAVFLAAAVGSACALSAVARLTGDRRTSLLGLLALVLTLTTVAAWWASFRSVWTSLLLVPLVMVALGERHIGDFAEWLIRDIDAPTWARNPLPWTIYGQMLLRAELARAAVVAVNLLAFGALLRRLARMGPEISRPRLAHRGKRVVTHSPAPTTAAPPAPCPDSGLWSQAWQRRLAVLRPGSPWLVAAVLCAVLLLLTLLIGPKNSDELRSCVLATILPGITVGVAWLERWPVLGYESLFPATRRRFAAEMALAMSADVAEFWLATTLAVMVPIAVWHSESLTSPLLRATILASAMMQLLMLGGIYWATVWRNRATYFAILGAIALAAAIPLEMAWAPRHALSEYRLLQFAFADMACGLILGLAGFVAWRRGEFA